METFKDFFEALENRVKSPVFGSILVSFIAINWKELFFLFFANTPVLDRLSYFEEGTGLISLLVMPLIVGTLIAILAPWVKFGGTYLARLPVQKTKSVQNTMVHQLLVEKQKLEDTRRSYQASKEQTLIEQAKRDQEVKNQIDNEQIRTELEEKLSAFRESVETKMNSTKSDNDDTSKVISDENLRQIKIIEDRIERLHRKKKEYIQNGNDEWAEKTENEIIIQLNNIVKIKGGKEIYFDHEDRIQEKIQRDLDDQIPF